MNITDDRSEAFPKEATVHPRTLAGVKSVTIHSLPMTIENKQSYRLPVYKETGVIDAMYENVYVDARSDRLSDIALGRLYQGEQHTRITDRSGASMNAHAAPFAPRVHDAVAVYHLLDRIFGGNLNAYKYKYFPESSEPTKWKAAFLACIDSAPATEEFVAATVSNGRSTKDD